MKPELPTILLCGLLIALTQPSWARKWTDSTGKFSVEAELVEVKDDKAVLKDTNGKVISLPVARLSETDRRYLESLAESDSQTSNGGVRVFPSFPDAMTEPPPWNDANTPFDLAEFLKAPLVADNAAPLYLDALREFSPMEMLELFPDLSLEEKKQVHLRNSLRYKEQRRLEDAWEKDPQSVDNAAVDAWLAKYDTGFEKLAVAQQRPKCMFQTGVSFASPVPHNQVVRQVAWVVEWRTRRDIQRGDLERPLQDLKMLFRLTRDLRVRGVLVAHFVASAVDGQCCERVRTILNAPGIDVGHCDSLLTLLAEHETKAIDAFLEANRAEYILCRQGIHDLQHRTGDFDPKSMRDELGISGDVTSPLTCLKIITDSGWDSRQKLVEWTAAAKGALLPGAWQGGKMLSDEDYAKEIEALNRYFGSILALAEQPNVWRMRRAEIEAALTPSQKPLRETTLAGFLVPDAYQRALLGTIRRSKARLRGTQCLVALRHWQLQHADAPPDLETLVKAAGMPRVPMDPYYDRPLRMGSLAGKPVIYSVGPDGKDDKAQVEWNFGHDKPGDFIFRLESPPQ